MEHLVEPLDADRHHRHVQAGADHADAGPEPVDLAGLGPPTLREDQDRKAGVEDLADVLQRLPRAGLALRSGNALKKSAAR